MPGVSSKRDVPGALGVGKVRLKFRPASEKKKSKLGVVLFLACSWLIGFSVLWSYQNIRHGYLIPLMQRAYFITTVIRKGIRPNNVFATKLFTEGRVYQLVPGKYQIEASSLSDAMFMQGYIHAFDHIFEMDYARRTANGQLSSLMGEEGLHKDIFARTLRFRQLAEKDYQRLSAREMQILTAYSEGINNYIHSLRLLSYPMEYWLLYGLRFFFEKRAIAPWEPIDTLALLRLQSFEGMHHWDQELSKWLMSNDQAKLSELFPTHTAFLQAADESEVESVKHINAHGGSMWLFRTPFGGFISSDIHKKYDSMSTVPVSMSIAFPQYNSSGVSYAGVPLIQFGNNEHVAWSYLVSDEQVSTIVPIVVSYDEPTKFELLSDDDNNKSINSSNQIFTETVDIEVVPNCPYAIWSKDCQPYVRSVAIQSTSLGPIITDAMSYSASELVLKKSFNDIEQGLLPSSSQRYEIVFQSIAATTTVSDGSIDRLFRWNTMSTWDEFVDICGGIDSSSLVVTFVDKQNNVGYVLTAAATAVDNAIVSPSLLVCSDTTDTEDQTCTATAAKHTAAKAYYNPIPPLGAMVFDDMQGALVDLTPVSVSDTVKPSSNNIRSMKFARNIISLIADETVTKRKEITLEEVMKRIKVAFSDSVSELSQELKQVILSINTNEYTESAKYTDMAKSHFMNSVSNQLIEEAQDLVHSYSDLRTGNSIFVSEGGSSADEYRENIAATIVEEFRIELENALLISPFSNVLKGSVWSPIDHLRDNVRSTSNQAIRLLLQAANTTSSNDDQPHWVAAAGGYEYVVRSSLVKAVRKLESYLGPRSAVGITKSSIKYVPPLNANSMMWQWFTGSVLQVKLTSSVAVLHPWDWGFAHSLVFPSKLSMPLLFQLGLSRGPFAASGGKDTILRSSYDHEPSIQGPLQPTGHMSFVRIFAGYRAYQAVGDISSLTRYVTPFTGLSWNDNADSNPFHWVVNLWSQFDAGMMHWLQEMGHVQADNGDRIAVSSPHYDQYITFHPL